ncbi:hypothetical protein DPMN_003249 [Dreissena polymorpha]|uniref:Uncharacterized protein n=1 Tax=Dreissena polymorpha TaxID=45954 RepID=A0A9D4RUR4_DREPO|nr:hypothetical protein DPMN_003249 [Dreissena polymorpha]
MLLKVNTSGFVTSTLHSEAKVHRIELRLKKASKHDTSFVVRSSTPFDSQPEVNQNSNSALISAQLLSFRRAPDWISIVEQFCSAGNSQNVKFLRTVLNNRNVLVKFSTLKPE